MQIARLEAELRAARAERKKLETERDILTGVPISTLLESSPDEPVDCPVWIGALRHLASWRSRTDEELKQVPPPVWDAVAVLAEARADSDTVERVAARRASIRAD